MSRGQEMDKYLTMYSDFLSNTIEFMIQNLDKVLMATIIVFLVCAWTIIFEWEFPEDGKRVVWKKSLSIDNYAVKTKRKGEVEGKLVTENMQNIDKLLENELNLDCGDDKLCQQNQDCLKNSDSYECSKLKNCCLIDDGKKKKCVGGGRQGPTYNINKIDEWWYLGNHYKKN
jgi:hypothetical protein